MKLPSGQKAKEFITLDEIKQTHDRIKPYIERTPVIQNDYFSKQLSDLVGHKVTVHFKCELFQKTGSFKSRGAVNAVMAARAQYTKGQLPGVVTHSSGNHGAATAYAAQQMGVKSTIVVPDFATPAKMANMEAYGAEVVKVEPRPECL